MKKKITAVILMFVIMALLPFAVAKCSDNNGTLTDAMSTADTPDKPIFESDYGKRLCALTAAEYKNDYALETVKAIAIILNTNYKLNPDSFTDKDFLYKDNASGNVIEIYAQIEDAAAYAKNKTLCKDNKAFYIPYAQSSNGQTYKSEDYSYLQSVASPWDCFLQDFDENANCIGVSLSGLDYLCKNGASAEEALRWYLPDFEVIDIM